MDIRKCDYAQLFNQLETSSEACYESLLQRATESEHDETNSKKIVPRMKNRLPIQGCHWSNS